MRFLQIENNFFFNKILNVISLQEEYEDEEDEEEVADDDDSKQAINSKFEHALEEEDPEVIKELIMLIKKVGGLEELEKQLQMRLNLNQNSPIVGKASTSTTTISPISQSLYNKVVGTKRGNLRTQKVINRDDGSSDIEPLIQRQNKENRYSSVIRNSRPRPQNDGIDQLSEDDGIILREKPQYTTITRTHAPKTQNDDSDDEQPSGTAAPNSDDSDESPATVTHQPQYQYVNIQRPRASTTASPTDSDEENDDHDENETEKVQPTSTSKMQYVNIQRIRPTKPQYLSDEIESETPAPENK